MKERSEESVEQPGKKRKGRRRGVGDAEVDRQRPASCWDCGAASRPPGGRLQVQGHGTRSRGLQGPRKPKGPPQAWDVVVRRYICVVCDVTMSVFPPGVLPRRRYGATAIAYALALSGLEELSHQAVRDAVGVHGGARAPAEQQRWASLVRWSRAARDGLLLDGASRAVGTLRAAAARMATTIAGYGPRIEDRILRVWEGALEAPWRGTS